MIMQKEKPRMCFIYVVFALAVVAAFTTGVQAYQGQFTPMLHVSGRNLQNSSGLNVRLMGGWMQPTASWFNGEGRWYSNPSDFTDPDNVAGFLDFMKEAADVMSDTNPRYDRSHGWYSTFVRMNTDDIGGWTGESGLVDSGQFDAWISNFLVPYADHLRSRGLYLVLSATGPICDCPDGDGTHNASIGTQSRLLTFWQTVANASGVKNADNIMFELMNEPVCIESSPGNGDWGNHSAVYFQAFKNWTQPIIDTIRNTGANNVIWVPTLEWQGSPYQWDQYPFSGSNIGVACHFYPAYGGVFDNTTALQNLWNSQYRPATDHWPMIITECFWFPIPEDPWNLCNGTTAGFGNALKGCIDSDGNVSWLIGFLGDLLDSLNDSRPQGCGLSSKEGTQAAFDWAYEYRNTAGAMPGNPGEPVNGLEYKYYEGTWNMLPDFDSLTPVEEGLCANFDVSSPPSADYFGFVFEGYVDIPADGTYTFYTTSDDGSKLYIGPLELVNNDGVHPMQEASGQIGLMVAGKHPIRVVMFEKDGGHGLEVRWEGPGITKELIPDSALYRDTTPPAAPAGLTATPDDGEVWLDWNDNSESDLAGYNVYRSTTSGSGYSKLNGSLLSGSDYTDNSVSNGTTYYYVVTAVDTSNNESGYSNEVGDVTPSGGSGSGTILREWWEEIGGTAVSDLTSNPSYPDNPTGSNEPTSFEAPTDWADNYGTRMRGYVHPSFSGDYTFWIAGDDNCELWLSTDDNPANASLIANVPGWTSSREWTKFPEQQSSVISLTGGQKYYIEALHKEGGGGDNLAVAWQRPGIGQKVIPGSYLSPWIGGGDTNPPAAPTGLTATAGDAQVSLDWADNTEPDLDGYNVYRSTTPGGGYSRLNGSLLSSSDYTDNSVSNGTTYYYVVTAVDTSNNESGYSSEASATPTGGGVAMLYQHYYYGGWSAGFDVGSYTTSDIVAAGGVDNDASSLTVQSGYKVTLYDGDNFTGSSLVLTSDTPSFGDYGFNDILSSMTIAIDEPDTTPPAAPTGLSATAGDATVSLDWNDNGEGDLDGYNVYRSTTSGSGYSQINGSLLSSSDYTDNSVSNGTTYYYVVTAVDTASNESSYSNEDSATPSGGGGATLLDDDFEGTLGNWNTDWDLVTSYYVSSSHSVECSSRDNDLISDDLDASGYSSITITFKYRVDDIDTGDDIMVQYYNGSVYVNIEEIGDDAEDTWLTYNHTTYDSQYLISNFRLKIEGSSIDSGENLWVDDVLITVE